MRILYVAAGIPVPGSVGGSTHVIEVCRGLAALGHELLAVVGPKQGDAQVFDPQAPIRLVQLPQRPELALTTLPTVWRLAREFRPAVVMERYYNLAGAGLLYARRHGLPSLLEVNAPLYDPPGSRKDRLDRVSGRCCVVGRLAGPRRRPHRHTPRDDGGGAGPTRHHRGVALGGEHRPLRSRAPHPRRGGRDPRLPRPPTARRGRGRRLLGQLPPLARHRDAAGGGAAALAPAAPAAGAADRRWPGARRAGSDGARVGRSRTAGDLHRATCPTTRCHAIWQLRTSASRHSSPHATPRCATSASTGRR